MLNYPNRIFGNNVKTFKYFGFNIEINYAPHINYRDKYIVIISPLNDLAKQIYKQYVENSDIYKKNFIMKTTNKRLAIQSAKSKIRFIKNIISFKLCV